MNPRENELWESVSIVDGAAVDRERNFGRFDVVNDTVNVRVAQRVDFDLFTDPVESITQEPRITVGGVFEFNDEQGERIAHGILDAVRFSRTLRSKPDDAG